MQNKVGRFGRNTCRREHKQSHSHSYLAEKQDNCDRSFGTGRASNDKFNRINDRRRLSNGDRAYDRAENRDSFNRFGSRRLKEYRSNRQNRNGNCNNCRQSPRSRGDW